MPKSARGQVANKEPQKESSTRLCYQITRADLPLSCPPRDRRVWDSHPRVYFPVEETGEYLCPYCGAKYILQDFVPPE